MLLKVARKAEAGTRSTGERTGRTTEEENGGSRAVRLSFRLPGRLHRRLKLEAVRQGRTIVGMVEGWIGEHTPAA